MRSIRRVTLAALTLSAVHIAPAAAQTGDQAVIPATSNWVSLSGPRFGATIVTGEAGDRLREDHGLRPLLTQFGWQFERRFFDTDAGIGGVNELIFLIGGLDQGTAIPSVSWVVGIRNNDGLEVGVGPNLSPAGIALAMGGGVTLRAGSVNFPLNLALVSSDSGVRISTLVGFTTRR